MIAEYDRLLAEFKTEFPRATVLDHGIFKGFSTTIPLPFGRHRVYMSQRNPATLRHERVHCRQARAMTAGIFWLLYLLLAIPVLFSARAILEAQGYGESVRARVQYGEIVTDETLHRYAAFCSYSPSYVFAAPWAYWWVRWYLGRVRDRK